MLRSIHFRAEKIEYTDGVGVCIWEPFPEDENLGICLDIREDQIDDLIELLNRLKTIPAEKIDNE